MAKEPIESPYVIDFESYKDSFDYYDDLPATTAWMHTIGAAIGKKFGTTVVPNSDAWEIDFTKNEARAGSIDEIYSRRGVLGLLLNGVGRLVFGGRFPQTKKDALVFLAEQNIRDAVDPIDAKLAKHFGALAKTIDEIRTDDKIAHEYSGGERVVDTMHTQAYDAAHKALQVMAMDMRARREMARRSLDWFKNLSVMVDRIAKENPVVKSTNTGLETDVKALMAEYQKEDIQASIQVSFGEIMQRAVKHTAVGTESSGRVFAVILVAMFPDQTDEIMKVLVRAYTRNAYLFLGSMSFSGIKREEEEKIIKLAAKIKEDVDEIELFSQHTGGHAQYVIAKAEQYYHAYTLGIQIVTPYLGYDAEARAMEVEGANEAAAQLAQSIWDKGITVDLENTLDFTKELLPLIAPFPFLDLNDHKKDGDKGNGSMGKRVAGAGTGHRQQKRKKEREKKSQADRAKDRKKMEAMDNKKNQAKVDQQRSGYSILDKGNIDPLERYLYIIGPYLSRIATTASRIRRLLKVNDPRGLRGAYNRGKALNTRILYRHRLDDFKLFARKEIDKDQSYGFAVMGDLSGSTGNEYGSGHRRIQDEVLAAAFLLAEVAERIGEKVMCSVGFFDNTAETIKRAGFYLNRSKIVTEITHHDGGTNVQAAGLALQEDLQEMSDFKIKAKTIVFITDGSFSTHEFEETVKAAKKHKASIAYFQICDDVGYGTKMCKEVVKFVEQNAKGVRVRTRNVTSSGISALPEAMAQLMKETVGITDR